MIDNNFNEMLEFDNEETLTTQRNNMLSWNTTKIEPE